MARVKTRVRAPSPPPDVSRTIGRDKRDIFPCGNPDASPSSTRLLDLAANGIRYQSSHKSLTATLFLRFFLFFFFQNKKRTGASRDRQSTIESGQTGKGGKETRGSENGFAVPRPKIIPWLASSIRVCLGLKGQQVILRRLERIYRGEGKQPKICFSDWTCGVGCVGCARGKEASDRRGSKSGRDAGKASFDARTIKVGRNGRNHQRMLSYGFSYSDLNPSGWATRTERNWHYYRGQSGFPSSLLFLHRALIYRGSNSNSTKGSFLSDRKEGRFPEIGKVNFPFNSGRRPFPARNSIQFQAVIKTLINSIATGTRIIKFRWSLNNRWFGKSK